MARTILVVLAIALLTAHPGYADSAGQQPDILRPDVLVVGAGTGGTAAAISATRNGASVVVLEETGWLGGQLTSQGVSCPDEHEDIETVASASFQAYRRLVRDYYTLGYRLSASGRAMRDLNPGNGWVSRLCHEPRAGVAAIDQLLRPAIDSGRLKVFRNARIISVVANRGTVREVAAEYATSMGGPTLGTVVVRPKMVVENTWLGDFLQAAGVPFSIGIESRKETGEPHAYHGEADPGGVQGLTYCFAIERRPGESHVIPRPARYEYFRDKRKRFGLGVYKVFVPTPASAPFWTYRRLVHAALFDDARLPNDIAMINWGSNDYHERDLVGASPAERVEIMNEAKQLSLGFLYWLQTECPRDDGKGRGYPELMLRPDVMGTTDGLSMHPYIRESRRIRALKTVTENDITTGLVRAAPQDDSVGIGYYYTIDIHVCVGDPRPADPNQVPRQSPRRYQVPMGALIPRDGGNVLAGGKNLGVTHVANGAYRLHPTEWNTGEAAGVLAAVCATTGRAPAQLRSDRAALRAIQRLLVAQGVPIFWYRDLSWNHPAFAGAQLLAMEKGWVPEPSTLNFAPDKSLTQSDRDYLAAQGVNPTGLKTRGEAALAYTGTGKRN